MARSRPLSGIVALLLTFGLFAGFPLAAAAADEVAFTINDDRITESSGLARDLAAGAYWTVNDSGDRGVAYGLSPTGKVLGTLNYRAQPEDVEAVAVFEDRLYIADIGDNAAMLVKMEREDTENIDHAEAIGPLFLPQRLRSWVKLGQTEAFRWNSGRGNRSQKIREPN